MSIQAHQGSQRVFAMPAFARRSASLGNARVGRRTVTVIAGAAIEAVVALAFVGMSVGVGAAPRPVSGQPGAAPYVTPAPEAAP
jgi:hypothetical protein